MTPTRATKRPSKLDAFKPAITRWLERHPYSATQIYQRLCADEGYTGGFSIVKEYVRAVRPVRRPAFLSLAFAPGEAAQVDWGSAGTIQLGATRRRLSFFVMVLCHSRMAYVEFTCGEAMEHFLACHQNALEFFGGTPGVILIDNLKTGVLSHRFGESRLQSPLSGLRRPLRLRTPRLQRAQSQRKRPRRKRRRIREEKPPRRTRPA